MDKTKENKPDKNLIYLPAFFIPAVIMAISFYSLDIGPGCRYTELISDLKGLYLSLYGYLSYPGPGFNNLFHSMSGGLGGNIYGTVILCISPTDIIFSIVPLRLIPTVLYFVILFKIGLCGVSACIYLTHNGKTDLPAPVAVLFSCCYAMMSYNIMYYMVPMWYDCVILLPLVALALEKVIAGKKSPAFIILMALCLIDDYYIAYMVVISLIIYFVFRSAEEGPGLKEFIRRSVSFMIHGLISSGISMFVLLPAIYDLQRGKIAENEFMTVGLAVKNTVADVLASLLPGSYAGMNYNASPNIFCGSIITLSAVIWFLLGKKNLRSRIAGLTVTAFYFVCFIVGPLDRMWHGFRDPVSFSVRYAFTFSFFMIIFAARGYESIVHLLHRIPSLERRLLFTAVCILSVAELFLNAKSILTHLTDETGLTTYEDYEGIVDIYDHLLNTDNILSDGTYGRIANTTQYTGFDGALFGYSGFSRFSSSYNYKVSELMRNLGFASLYHSSGDKGMTPASLGLFDTGYIISLSEEDSGFYEPVYEYEGYKLLRYDRNLPFAYAVNSVNAPDEFGTDPYGNLNAVYSELFGTGSETGTEIFKEVPCILEGTEDTGREGVDSSERYTFTAGDCGHYFLGVEFRTEVVFPDELRDEKGNYKPLLIIRDYILDGETGQYGNGQSSFCIDLGCLEKGTVHDLTLMSSNDDIGEFKVYYFDENAYGDVISRTEGFDIESIDKKGISLNGSISGRSDILITLPFEEGYRVYVDGVRTGYKSYRDTLMVIEAEPGEHEIVIGYFPPGLYPGILLSMLSVICFMLYTFLPGKGKNK